MALSPITPLTIQSENVLVDLQPTSLHGAEHDTAMINTTMLLQAPATESVIFALPSFDAPLQEPMLRVVAETPGVAEAFAETTFAAVDKELRELFAQARRDDREFWDALRQGEAQHVSFARVRIEAGEQLIRFHYPQKVPKLEDGSFQFRVLAPLASFVLNGGGGDISFVAALPRVYGRAVELMAATTENPPGSPAQALTEQAAIAQRLLVGHYVKQDPIYTITYRYQ